MQDNIVVFPFPSPDEGSRLARHHLPTPLTPLIGREQEVAVVCALLQREVRLVTLRGTGGVGKTRLALQVAADLQGGFVDGVFFISLASLRDPDLVLPTIAHALGLTETGDWPLLERLYASLGEKHVLLVLDNFEQVATAAPQLSELLMACPHINLLVTSRAVLHIGEEYEYAVPPLTVPDLQHLPQLPEPEKLLQSAAVALFLQRARAIKPAFQLTPANAGAIAEICVRLDGLPLAIELAAARINLLSSRALLERLSHRLAVLTSTSQNMPARQQTLRSTLTWSYDLLSTEVQQLFGYLSVFVGGCTLEAVESVCCTNDDSGTLSGFSILDGVASLVDTSLLNAAEQEDQEIHFTMLETIREFGWECLLSSGEARVIQRAHATYYLRLAEEAELKLIGLEQGAWLKRLEREHENLRAALQWWMDHGESEMALRLGGALFRFWWMDGNVREGCEWLEKALMGSEETAVTVRAKALNCAGGLATIQGRLSEAKGLLTQGLQLFREQGEPRGLVTSLYFLGYIAMEQSKFAEVRTLGDETLALSRAMDDPGASASALWILGSLWFFQGDYEHSCSLLEESVALSREAGDTWSITHGLFLLGMVLLFGREEPGRAGLLLEESLMLAREAKYKALIGYPLWLLGVVALQAGDIDTARSRLEESLEIFQEVGMRQDIGSVLGGLSVVSLVQGDYIGAQVLLEESLKIAREMGNKWLLANSLVGFGAVTAARGEPARGVHLLAVAQSLCESINGVLMPASRTGQDFTVAALRTQLGENLFQTLWTEGRAMTLEQVLDAPAELPPTPGSPRHVETTTQEPPILSSEHAPVVSASLTPREKDVLRLLAQGLTSAQIAEQLVIGLVTVNFHVRSIYSKLGVSSRSAATRYAIEHKLA
jgi:predicted ATPase/DNA-binding CsgD family transcriptional regulator